ncbi:MAG: ATP-binding protein [Chloroflexota bacterium]
METRTQIGYLVGGGLKENFRVRLTVSSQDIQEGAFVVLRSGLWQYYGIVTDIQLGATDPRFADEQSETRLPASLAKALHGQTLYANLEVLPNLMLEIGPDETSPDYRQWISAIDAGLKDRPRPIPVKNVPPHHAEVYLASEGDIAEIFGDPAERGNFVIGATREQDHPVCINLEKFVQRSSGVFGATGTGKSFLTRLVLAGLIHYNKASVLVLDMHNEYGFDDTASDSGMRVIGLKKFGSRVQVVGVGAGAAIRGNTPDFNLEVAMRDVRPADVEMLSRELNLKETTPTVLDALINSLGAANWFQRFRGMLNGATVEIEDERTGRVKKVPDPNSVAAWALENGVNVMAAEALHSKLGRLFNKPYIVENPASDSVGEVIKSLEAGKHVILSFGEFESDLDYLFVSNLLTRKIRDAWEKRTNDFRTHGGNEPRHLIIVIEEAHKLLNREMAAQTTFSTIARELRKYYVTLLIVDQRPSQIYDEVMSQLGTRISGWLGDEDDIHAVLSGLAGREALRGMLARLQPKEEVLLLGWGVPMPLPVRSRRYDDKFWKDLLGGGRKSEAQNLKELGF